MRKRRFSLPFFSILAIWISADFLGLGDMCAAAGLAVNRGVLADADEADAAEAHRRADVLRFDDIRIGGELLVGDPLQSRPDDSGSNNSIMLDRHRVLVDSLGHVEIDAAFILADGSAGDRKGADDGKQMAGRVHAHQLVAARPIDMQHQRLADHGPRLRPRAAHG